MSPVLRFSRSSEDFLVTSAGERVWPARDEGESALRRLADTFGATLSETEAVPGESHGDDGVVLGIGEQNRHNARLYAHLTRRQFQIIHSLDEVARLDGVRVIVCLWNQLTFATLDRVQAHSLSHDVIGLIVGHDPSSMRNQVLTRAAAACLPGAADPTATLIFTDWEGTEQSIGRMHLFGARAGLATLASAYARAGGVLFVSGHGDGLDMQLGGRETLCSVIGQDLTRTTGEVPDCVKGRYCYRARRPIDAALSAGDLVDPRLMRARVGVLTSCYTIPARGALVDPHWSLVARCIESPSGALLSAFGLASLSWPGRLALTQALLSEENVGAALKRFNQCEDVTAGRIRVCLFGDPRTRVPLEPFGAEMPAQRDSSERVSATPRGASPPEKVIEARRQLLLRVIGEGKRTAADAHAIGLLDRATDLIQAARLGGGHAADDPGLGEGARLAIEGLLQCNPLWHLLARFATPSEEVHELRTECAACGERVRVHRQPFSIAGDLSRLQARCDRCGVRSDVENGSDLLRGTFELDAMRLTLPEGLRKAQVCAGIRVRPWHRKGGISCLLSGDSRVPGPLEPGLSSAYVLALDGLELVFLRRLVLMEGPRRAPEPEDRALPVA